MYNIFIFEYLHRDGELISDTEEEHAHYLKNALSSTKKHLNAVKISELWERYSIAGSLCFFFSVVFYIVAKRTRLLYLLWILLSSLFTTPDSTSIAHLKHITDHEPVVLVDDPAQIVDVVNVNDWTHQCEHSKCQNTESVPPTTSIPLTEELPSYSTPTSVGVTQVAVDINGLVVPAEDIPYGE